MDGTSFNWNSIITPTFTVLGIIIGSIFTYLISRSQFKNQKEYQINTWRRDKTIDLISNILTEVHKLNNLNFINNNLITWFENFEIKLFHRIIIFLGYQNCGKIQNETRKLLKFYYLYLKDEVNVEQEQLDILKSITNGIEINHPKKFDDFTISDFISTIQVEIEKICTEFLILNFEEFKNLDYRKSLKFSVNNVL